MPIAGTADSKEALQRWADAWRLAAEVNEADRRRSLRELTEASAWTEAQDLPFDRDAWRNPHEEGGFLEHRRLLDASMRGV